LGTLALDPTAKRLASCDVENRLLIWEVDGDDEPLMLDVPPGDCMKTEFSPDGSLIAQVVDPSGGVLWDLEGPAGAEPLSFDGAAQWGLAFSPDGRWLAAAYGRFPLSIWPMTKKYIRILRGHDSPVQSIEFAADSTFLYSQGVTDGKVLAWPLAGDGFAGPTVVHHTPGAYATGLAVDPNGRFLVVATEQGAQLVPFDGSGNIQLGPDLQRPRLDNTGRFLVAQSTRHRGTVHVIDLEAGKRWEVETPGEGRVGLAAFDADGHVLASRGGVVSRWDPATEDTEILFEDVVYGYPHPDGRVFVKNRDGSRWLVDMTDGSRMEFYVPAPTERWTSDPTGSIFAVEGDDGTVLAWTSSDSTPHLLAGYEERTSVLQDPRISRDGKWIAALGVDDTIRLWPAPDFSKPPIFTLPHAELVAKLKAFTNLRVIPDERSHTGYTLEPDLDAYRGWVQVPEW
jgi:WD40 repeat protein